MNFARAFLSTLAGRPRDALAALYWRITGRRVRARNRLRIAAEQMPGAYRTWIRTVERVERAALTAPAGAPAFTVVLHCAGGDSARTLASLEALDWPSWELVVVHGRDAPPLPIANLPRVVLSPTRTDNFAAALEAGLAASRGEWIVPIASGTRLPPDALAAWAAAIAANPEATAFYGDHDQISPRGVRSRPWFKPRWNHDLVLAQDYVSPACAIAAASLGAALPLPADSDGAAAYAVLLKLAARGEVPVHVPQVQAHVRDALVTSPRPARMAVLARHLAGTGADLREGVADTVSVAWPLPAEPPLVSVIVPTRDNLALIRECIHGVLTRTRYRPIELLIVDNGSVSPDMLAYLDRV
ncbi:MAG: glycosyltransferase, partial [Sphingomonadales bacterium]|nr:glycosyltransferase [Sphingomonadales bacterium]